MEGHHHITGQEMGRAEERTGHYMLQGIKLLVHKDHSSKVPLQPRIEVVLVN